MYVQFNTTIRCQDCLKKQGSFDEIVIATGSTRKTLTINGFDKTIDAVDYLSKNIDVGKNPLVIGGGLTGCEIAYDLCLKGIKPIIIEINNDLMATKGICMANSTYLRDYFALHKIPVHLNSFVKEVLGDGVIVSTNDGNETYVKCSGVISSIGYTPAPILNKKTPHVYYVGDCHQVGNLRTVIWRAWDVAMKL